MKRLLWSLPIVVLAISSVGCKSKEKHKDSAADSAQNRSLAEPVYCTQGQNVAGGVGSEPAPTGAQGSQGSSVPTAQVPTNPGAGQNGQPTYQPVPSTTTTTPGPDQGPGSTTGNGNEPPPGGSGGCMPPPSNKGGPGSVVVIAPGSGPCNGSGCEPGPGQGGPYQGCPKGANCQPPPPPPGGCGNNGGGCQPIYRPADRDHQFPWWQFVPIAVQIIDAIVSSDPCEC